MQYRNIEEDDTAIKASRAAQKYLEIGFFNKQGTTQEYLGIGHWNIILRQQQVVQLRNI
jgi:hypothetical protein